MPTDDCGVTPRAPGLIVARIGPETAGESITIVDELDQATIDRIRRTALTLRARYAAPITIEARYVDAPDTEVLVGTLDELRSRGIHLRRAHRSSSTAAVESNQNARDGGTYEDPAPPLSVGEELAQSEDSATAGDQRETATAKLAIGVPEGASAGTRGADAPVVATSDTPHVTPAGPSTATLPSEASLDDATRFRHTAPAAFFPSPDPFGVEIDYRRSWLGPLRFLFERYWRTEVSGIEHVPTSGSVLIAANHSGAIPADAFMLAVALELHHPTRRCLRVLYDKFVEALPWIGPLYNRLGGVPSSFANAELLLRRGEALAIFPEGIAGVEKRWRDRYQLQPFKSGTARLAIATGSPIVPVAIVGAEEAYPVVARLYRAGRLVGVPWIPVTPLFPLCGVAGALPLPTKWRIRFCPPVLPPPATPDDEDAVSELTAAVRRSIALALGDLLLTRRGVFV